MNKEKIYLFSIIAMFVLLGITSSQSILAWIEPGQSAPNKNASTTINIGIDEQSKEGPLIIGANHTYEYGLIVDNGMTFMEGGLQIENHSTNPADTASRNGRIWVKSLCGDGVVDSGEECDDGGSVNSDGCSSNCICEGTWVTTSAPACPTACGQPPQTLTGSVACVGDCCSPSTEPAIPTNSCSTISCCASGWTPNGLICTYQVSYPKVWGTTLGAGTGNSAWVNSASSYCNQFVKSGSKHYTSTQNLCGPYYVCFSSETCTGWSIRNYGCIEKGGASSITCYYTP